jgi:hypothetical protein
MHFKMTNEGGEFYVSPRRRFPTVQALLSAYKTLPMRSKRASDAKIYLICPIPVDPAMEEQCKRKLEDKGQWGQEKLMNLLI